MFLFAALAAVHSVDSASARHANADSVAHTRTLFSQSFPTDHVPALPANEPQPPVAPREPIQEPVQKSVPLVLEPSQPATAPPTVESQAKAEVREPAKEVVPPMFTAQRREPAEVVAALLDQPALNKFGNPEGNEFGLSRAGEFAGARLLAWTAEPEVHDNIFTGDNPLWAALKEKGFEVQLEYGRFDQAWLERIDQLWVFSGRRAGLDTDDEEAIVSFIDAGKGVYMIADNAPYLVDVSSLTYRLFGTRLADNYRGGNILAVRGHGVTRDDYRPTGGKTKPRQRNQGVQTELADVINRATHYVEEHPLLTDVNFIFEGVTISHIEPTPRLQVVLTASDGQILAAVSSDTRRRVVVDCGFTRYFYSGLARCVTETAGTVRYAENISAYLMYKDDKGADGAKWREKRKLLTKYQTAEMSAILAGLKHSSPEERWAAIVGAIHQRLDIPEQLIELLRDPESDVRATAHHALVRLANGNDFGPSSDSDESARSVAIGKWHRWRVSKKFSVLIAKGSAGAIVTALGAADSEERWAAVMAIRAQKLHLVEELCDRLGELHTSIQQEARQTLQQLARNKDFGPQPGASPEAAAEAAQKWRDWWKQEREEAAAQSLNLAKSILAKNPEAGRRRLQKIIKEHGDTQAAREAQRLLDEPSR
jgi:hypothetical protein